MASDGGWRVDRGQGQSLETISNHWRYGLAHEGRNLPEMLEIFTHREREATLHRLESQRHG